MNHPPFHLPTEVEFQNPTTKYRKGRGKDGTEIFLAEFEINKDLWEELRAVRNDARLKGVLWQVDNNENPVGETKNKPEKGPAGDVAQLFFSRRLQYNPNVAKIIGYPINLDLSSIKDKVRSYFQVDSLTYVEPEDWLELLTAAGISGQLFIDFERSIAALSNSTTPSEEHDNE